jgi:hypothetical protein
MAKHSVAGTVADPTIEFADLKLAGKTYRLVYSFNAIAEAEHVAGCNLLAGLESLRDLTALQLRGLLYAAMSVADPKITIEQAGSLVRLDTIEPITEALGKAYQLSMPAKRADPPAASAPAES